MPILSIVPCVVLTRMLFMHGAVSEAIDVWTNADSEEGAQALALRLHHEGASAPGSLYSQWRIGRIFGRAIPPTSFGRCK